MIFSIFIQEQHKSLYMKYLVFSDIPKVLHSSKTKKPFDKCVMCEKELLSENSYYFIEKAFNQNIQNGTKDVLFEYAICMDCHEKIAKDLSKESLERIKMYFDLYVDFDERDTILFNKRERIDFADWVSECVISKKNVAQLKEYQIAAMCYEDKVMYGSLPMAIGFEAADELQQLLSKETKDTIDRFQNYIFPPKVWDEIPSKRLIFI